MIIMSGIALYNYHWLNSLGVVMVLYAAICKANNEEKLLFMRFTEYNEYQQKTHRFLPYIY